MAPAEKAFSYFVCNDTKSASKRNRCQEGEIGRWENYRGRLSATLSFRVLSPSSLLFHVSSSHHVCLFIAPRESLHCLPPPRAALTTQGFNGKKRSCLFLSTWWICQMSTIPRNINDLKASLDSYIWDKGNQWLELSLRFTWWPSDTYYR